MRSLVSNGDSEQLCQGYSLGLRHYSPFDKLRANGILSSQLMRRLAFGNWIS